MSLPREIRQEILLHAILDNGKPVKGYYTYETHKKPGLDLKYAAQPFKFAHAVGVAYQTLLICMEVTNDKAVATELVEDVEYVMKKWEEEYEVVHKTWDQRFKTRITYRKSKGGTFLE